MTNVPFAMAIPVISKSVTLFVTPKVSPTIFRQQIPQTSGIHFSYERRSDPNDVQGSAAFAALLGMYTGSRGTGKFAYSLCDGKVKIGAWIRLVFQCVMPPLVLV